jgi:alanine dehydrogenase
VGNMPGAVPFTSTYALTNATLPYVAAVARDVRGAAVADPALAGGFNCVGGSYTNDSVAASVGATWVSLGSALV